MTVVLPHNIFNQNEITIYVYLANKEEGLPKNKSEFSSSVVCFYGSCVIKKENIEQILVVGSEPFNLKAGEWYEIEALENGTVFMNMFAKSRQ